MRGQQTRRLVLGLFTGFLIVSSTLLLNVTSILQAQTPPANGGQGFQISPVIVELNADPGRTYTINLKLKNVTSGSLLAKAQVNDFGAKNENGDPEIFLDNTGNRTFSMKQWVSPMPNTLFKTQESKNMPVNIKVPADAEPGGHYGVVRFSGIPPELEGDSSAVALSASIGTLVLIRVSGNIKESAQVASFYTVQHGRKKGFFENGPLDLVERIQNNGNVHIKPKGSVEVKNMLGKTVATLPVNDPPKNVLPDSIRRFEQKLDKKWLFGRYKAKLHLSYGSSNQNIYSTITFWIIPWKLILAILALVIVVILLLGFAIKRYNRYIIRKSKK